MPSGTEDGVSSELEKARREYAREWRLVDQTISMQAWLRDKARLSATVLTCTVLIASAVGVAFAFANNDQSLDLLGLRAARTTWLGWLAVLTMSMAVIDLVLDRRGAAGHRREAVALLAALKTEYRTPALGDDELAALHRLHERYRTTMEAVPPIPERLFNRLKANHLRKIEISKMLSSTPGLTYGQAKKRLAKRLKSQNGSDTT